MDEKMVRFVDSKSRELFSLPDGRDITLTELDGKQSRLPCKYTSDYHAEIDGHIYSLVEFARIQEREGAVFAPDWTRPEDACGVYEIYQIKDIGNTDYAFRSFEEARKIFDPLDYRRVYASMLAPDVKPDELYALHNRDDRPFGDKIHAMSMSDIVIISLDGHSTALYMDKYSFTVAPQFFEPETISGAKKEVVAGYTVTVQIPVGNSNTVFALAENPGAPSPFVTWHGHKTIKGYEWGHYFDRRTDAVKDLYKRVTDERDNMPFTYHKPKQKNRDDAR